MEAVKTTTILTQTPAETEVKGKVEKKSGKRIGYNYIILKSLKESKKNDVVKCLYIKSLVNFGICVIKEGTYGDSKDKEGRDIKDKLIWQKQLHEELQDIVRLPRYLGSFEENGNYYLVIERIKGKSLYRVCREKNREFREGLNSGNKLGIQFLGYLIQLTELLDTLHRNGVIHRDVSTNNFMIMPSGKMAVIDMELSYSFGKQLPSPPFQLGTHGFMSPQQEAMKAPSVKDDIFSVGAIILQVWTSISPSKLTNAAPEELRRKVQFLIPDHSVATVVLRCLDPESNIRPTLREVKQVMEEYKKDLFTKKKRALSQPFIYEHEKITDCLQQAIGTLASPLLTDEHRGWFSEDRTAECNPDKRKINKTWYTSFNMGAAGVLYFLSQAKKTGFDTAATMPSVEKALQLIETKYISRIENASPSLHFGSSGIAACLANAIREKLVEPQTAQFEWINQLLSVENSQSNFIDGIAGQGMAHWHCQPFLQEEQMQKRLESYVQRLLQQQHKNGSWITGKTKKGPNATKGFARGTAGIVYFLLEYAMQYQDRDAIQAAQRGLNWLIRIARHKRGIIHWRTSSDKELGFGWDEGSAGIALAFMKGYTLLDDQLYKKIASEALLSLPKNIVDNNLSQLCGLSGIGEVYLEAFQTFKEQEWKERADHIAQVIMHLKKDHKYGPYWLAEHERQPIADFMRGNSGILHFLLRYTNPGQIAYPIL